MYAKSYKQVFLATLEQLKKIRDRMSILGIWSNKFMVYLQDGLVDYH